MAQAPQDEEETLTSLLSNDDSQTLTNPYVIVSGIENYAEATPKGVWPDLHGVAVDVKNVTDLWRNVYNYQDMSVAFMAADNDDADKNNENKSSTSENKQNNANKNEQDKDKENNSGAMKNKQSFNDFLVHTRATIDTKCQNDGLIFYYSGHGVKNGVILGNGSKYPIKNIYSIFNGEHCVSLRNKPKIMIFDCCRGNNIASLYQLQVDKKKVVSKGPNNAENDWINSKFHVNSGLAQIFSNFEDFSIADSRNGGCLTRAFVQIFGDRNSSKNHSLRDLIIALRRQTKINSGCDNQDLGMPTNLVDFRDALEYKVYFQSNNDNNKDTNANSETESKNEIQTQQWEDKDKDIQEVGEAKENYRETVTKDMTLTCLVISNDKRIIKECLINRKDIDNTGEELWNHLTKQGSNAKLFKVNDSNDVKNVHCEIKSVQGLIEILGDEYFKIDNNNNNGGIVYFMMDDTLKNVKYQVGIDLSNIDKCDLKEVEVEIENENGIRKTEEAMETLWEKITTKMIEIFDWCKDKEWSNQYALYKNDDSDDIRGDKLIKNSDDVNKWFEKIKMNNNDGPLDVVAKV